MPGLITRHNGLDLEDVSDSIDAVNVLKGRLSKPIADATTSDSDSEFDSVVDSPVSVSDSEHSDSESELVLPHEPPSTGDKFRQYDTACERVKAFYREQHQKQTYEFNLKVRDEFRKRKRERMGVWQAIEMLNTLIDDSDPDTELSQLEHLLQTAEAIRRDGKPEWMQVTGLIHDLGKLLYFFGSNGQWDVVGDTFIVGCAFSDKNIYPETFEANPDFHDPVLSSKYGIYKPNCGLEKVMISWGHDEYLYQVVKDQSSLPFEALAMIRYHSFYPWHREGAYMHLTNAKDQIALKAVREFNPYDLYSKASEPCDVDGLRPYYQDLIAKFFPAEIDW